MKNHELSDADLWSYFLCDREYLYGFHYGYDGNESTYPKDSRYYIFRTDLEGKNKVEIVLPDGEAFTANCGVGYDAGVFYFPTETKDGAVIRVADFAAMELQTIHQFPKTDYSWNISGVSDAGLLISTFNSDAGVGSKYYSYDLTTGELAESDITPEPYQWNGDGTDVGEIVAESSREYLIFAGFEAAETSLYQFNENVFPAFYLISKDDYAAGKENHRTVEKLF